MAKARFTSISPQQFIALQNQLSKNDVILLDVRTVQEYLQNHLTDAINIDIKQADFTEEIMELDATKNYIVYCQVGIRSANACCLMNSLGFNKLFNLKGGLRAITKTPLLTTL